MFTRKDGIRGGCTYVQQFVALQFSGRGRPQERLCNIPSLQQGNLIWFTCFMSCYSYKEHRAATSPLKHTIWSSHLGFSLYLVSPPQLLIFHKPPSRFILFHGAVVFESFSATRAYCAPPVMVTPALPKDPLAYNTLGYNHPCIPAECHCPLTPNQTRRTKSLLVFPFSSIP